MKISIITVVRNSKDTIEETIKSVLSQTYPNIEYIVIDGASTDGTLAIIRRYEDKISKIISEEDKGVYDAMNKGLRIASGDVIGFLNSDDLYFDNKIIEKVASIFKKYSVDSLYGDLIYVDRNSPDKIVRYWKSSNFAPGSFLKGWHPPHPTFFVRKKIYERYGCFNLDLRVSSDFELMLRFLERYKISTYYLPEILVKMRIGGQSNNSIKNIIQGNVNIIKAFEINGIKVNKFKYLFLRLFPKVKQFIKKHYASN